MQLHHSIFSFTLAQPLNKSVLFLDSNTLTALIIRTQWSLEQNSDIDSGIAMRYAMRQRQLVVVGSKYLLFQLNVRYL